MNPKRFYGKDIATALRAVRESLGPDALILGTKAAPDGKNGGVEITALVETPEVETAVVVAPISAPPPVNSAPLEEVRDEIAALRSMLTWLAPNLDQKHKILASLIGQGLSPEVTARISTLMEESDGADDREKLYGALNRLIPSGGQIQDAVDRLALIGPTGVGKTMNMIKLTVLENQRLKRRIGWINADYRCLTGGEPLALYASILGVRYEVAENGEDLRSALERLNDCDLILIDTAGTNPRDQQAMGSLAELLKDLTDVRRALLCTAAANSEDMGDWVRAYECMSLNSLFFTKVDECRHFGPLINTAIGAGYPLSYISLGQEIAGDLEIAKPEVITSLLMSGGNLHE
jgi:flagellar biosynthesis GTPase FlhF